jgi:hypothetical protein
VAAKPCQQLGGAGVAPPAPEGLELEADRDHGLDGVVVDVAGDLAPLLLLAGDHPFQQRAALLVAVAQGRWCSVTSRSTTSQPIGGPSRSVMATTVGS